MALKEIQACVFDAYGTLFDVNSAAENCRGELEGKADELSALWRLKQLQYTWLRSLMGTYVPFWQVTGDALDFALESLDLFTPELREMLMNLYLELGVYPEVAATLKVLKTSGMKTAILSNGSSEMLNSAVSNSGISEFLDNVITVDPLQIYKPHPSVYQLACDNLRVNPKQICFLSSNGWDAQGAAHFGFNVVWINRFAQKQEKVPGTLVGEIKTLDQLLPLLNL